MNSQRPRILLIDDEIDFTRLLKTNLEESAGYDVAVENNPAEALATARRVHPDFIVLDVIMPGDGGGAVAAEMERDPDLRRVPLTFLTAAIRRDEVGGAARVIGGRVFMAKPVRVADLVHHIEHRLARRT